MNVKYFLLFAVLLLFVMAANAQNQEPTDSLIVNFRRWW